MRRILFTLLLLCAGLPALMAQTPGESQFGMGKTFYDSGDYATALPYLQSASRAGHADATFHLGMMNLQGRGMAVNVPAAVNYFNRAAAAGSGYAQLWLGKLCCQGTGMAKDYAKAMTWFMKSSEQGVPEAWLAMGDVYWNGWGVDENRTTAMVYYLQAAESGLGEACLAAGRAMQEKGNYAEAMNWYRKACDSDKQILLGAGQIGALYEQGLGVPADKQKAEEWYTSAAAVGDAWSSNRLGVMCLERGDTKAEEWFARAMQQGDSVLAPCNMGRIRFRAKAYTEAQPYFETAHAKGNLGANYYLGQIYLQGLGGIDADSAKAEQYYLEAAGLPDVFNVWKALGDFYYNPAFGAAQQDAKVTDYYIKAAAGRSGAACRALEKMGEGGNAAAAEAVNKMRAETRITAGAETLDFPDGVLSRTLRLECSTGLQPRFEVTQSPACFSVACTSAGELTLVRLPQMPDGATACTVSIVPEFGQRTDIAVTIPPAAAVPFKTIAYKPSPPNAIRVDHDLCDAYYVSFWVTNPDRNLVYGLDHENDYPRLWVGEDGRICAKTCAETTTAAFDFQTKSIQDGKLHLVTLVKEGNTKLLYVDGEPVGALRTGNSAGRTGSINLVVGIRGLKHLRVGQPLDGVGVRQLYGYEAALVDGKTALAGLILPEIEL